MEREGVLNGGRSAIDWFGSGTSTMERDRTRSLRGNRGSGGDRVDGGSSMERSHTRPMVGLGSGNATAPDASNGSGVARPHARQDKERRSNGNPGDEDVVMMNDSPTTEATWKGLLNNDIYHIWNHGPKIGGGFDCRYCRLKSRGGGATRFREHLAGIPGDVRECPNVPRNVRAAMRESRDVTMLKKREKASHRLRIEQGIIEGMYPGVINLEDDDD